MANKFTRRSFLTGLSATATYLALLANTVGCDLLERTPKRTPKVRPLPNVSSAQSELVLTFRSRPDLSPPAVEVATRAHEDTAPGYIFVTPKQGGPGQGGSMILDDRGQLVWFRPLQGASFSAMDFKVQNYRGEPVLTWWEGFSGSQQGLDEYVILDSSYGEMARFRAGNGYRGDHHEFLISPQDTALITIYNLVRGDLSPVGGPKDGLVLQGSVQEIDIESGEVLFEWHSLEHVGIEETYAKPSEGPFPVVDYFHINSIDVDHDDNLLISARNTSAVYKIDRNTGEVMWRLGGKKSDFEMGSGTRTRYQHDARRQPEGTITIFDNGTTVFEDDLPKAIEESRGIVLELDMEKMNASLVREYTHPEKQLAPASGNVQVLPNDNVFIGWGRALADFSEFGKDGELLFSASFSTEDVSYRAFRFEWSGHPKEQPAAVAERTSEEEVKLYASWNGATEVASWEVVAGPSAGKLESVGSVPREGFETAMVVRSAEAYVAVRAKDRSGRVLGSSEPVKL